MGKEGNKLTDVKEKRYSGEMTRFVVSGLDGNFMHRKSTLGKPGSLTLSLIEIPPNQPKRVLMRSQMWSSGI